MLFRSPNPLRGVETLVPDGGRKPDRALQVIVCCGQQMLAVRKIEEDQAPGTSDRPCKLFMGWQSGSHPDMPDECLDNLLIGETAPFGTSALFH